MTNALNQHISFHNVEQMIFEGDIDCDKKISFGEFVGLTFTTAKTKEQLIKSGIDSNTNMGQLLTDRMHHGPHQHGLNLNTISNVPQQSSKKEIFKHNQILEERSDKKRKIAEESLVYYLEKTEKAKREERKVFTKIMWMIGLVIITAVLYTAGLLYIDFVQDERMGSVHV